MKKLEQAIAYFEDAIRESDEIIAECSEALQKELTEQKGHFEVALEAMKQLFHTTQYEGGKTWLGMQEKKEVKLTNENSIKCNYFNV